MKTIRDVITTAVCLLVLTGCGGMRLDPTDDRPSTITMATDHAKMLTFQTGMVWCYDMSARRCLRLPPGTYTIEGEDAVWRYFRAPEPMDFRFRDKPEHDRQRFIRGGVALRKGFDIMLPAEVYIDSDSHRIEDKVLIFKLGNDFADREGSVWRKNF
jgi:hypothetical protein